jgi:PKD repeat protein
VAVANDTDSTAVEIRERTVDPVTAAATPPTDPDEDGEYEDVDGDGRASFRDVVVLFANLDDPAVRADPGAFDFDGDGDVSYADVVAFFRRL